MFVVLIVAVFVYFFHVVLALTANCGDLPAGTHWDRLQASLDAWLSQFLKRIPPHMRLYRASIFYTIQGGPKKLRQIFSCNNFGKYGPILIMFSLLHSQMN